MKNTTKILTLADERLKPYFGLKDRALARAAGADPRMIVESLYAIKAAAEAGICFESLLIDERHVDHLLELCPQFETDATPIFVASRELLSETVGFSVTRGYYGCCYRPQVLGQEELITAASSIVVLEDLVDTTNLGAIVRNAAAFGIDGLLLSPECADPLSRRAIRSSMGNIFRLKWARAEKPWPKTTLEQLKAASFETFAFALTEDALELDRYPGLADKKVAFFFGTEGEGLSEKLLAHIDHKLIIPMADGVDSLNVAASTAVAFWELKRRISA